MSGTTDTRQSRFDFTKSAFDGETYDDERDGARLHRQLEAVRRVMARGEWLTLKELARRVGGSEPSVSARLRDLRKARFGRHTIARRYVGEGVWRYRMEG